MSVSVVAVPTVFAIHLAQIVGAAVLTSAIQAAATSQSLERSEQDNKLSQKAKEYEDAFFKERQGSVYIPSGPYAYHAARYITSWLFSEILRRL